MVSLTRKRRREPVPDAGVDPMLLRKDRETRSADIDASHLASVQRTGVRPHVPTSSNIRSQGSETTDNQTMHLGAPCVNRCQPDPMAWNSPNGTFGIPTASPS